MTKKLAIMLTLVLVFVLSTVLMAAEVNCIEPFYADHQRDSGTLTLNLNKVVYLEIRGDRDAEFSGFQIADIRNGFIVFHNAHHVHIDAATPYELAANIHCGNSTFTEIIPTSDYYVNNVNLGANVPWSHNSVSQGIFRNFTYARADNDENSWVQVDTIGDIEEANGGSNHQVLTSGDQTLGTPGHDYWIDFKLDFTSVIGETDFEVPSGEYFIDVNYLVLEN